MKFFVAFAALFAVAAASPLIRNIKVSESELAQIIAAIQSPSTDPATAAVLEQHLLDILGVAPIIVGPAIVDSVQPVIVVDQPETFPISVGPAIVDFPIAPSPVIVAPGPIDVSPSPVIISPSPAEVPETFGAPLVQIILNINQAESAVPSVVAEAPTAPTPVIVVDQAPIAPTPVIVVDQAPIAPTPVIVVDQAPIAPTPVIVVDQPLVPVVIGTPVLPTPIVPEPVIVGTPVLPTPVINLPEILN